MLRLLLAGPVAQLGARVNGIHEVRGSNPLWSTIFLRGAGSARQNDAGQSSFAQGHDRRRIVKLFCAIVDEDNLLPHFLKHYSAVGIDHFFFAVNEAITSSVESVTRHWPCTVWCTANAAESLYGVKAVSGMRRRVNPMSGSSPQTLTNFISTRNRCQCSSVQLKLKAPTTSEAPWSTCSPRTGGFHLCRHRTEICGRSFRAGAPSPESFEKAPAPSAESFVERHRPTTA